MSTGANNINFFSPNKDKDKKNNLILHESIKEEDFDSFSQSENKEEDPYIKDQYK